MENMRVEELITSEKDGKWPSLKELRKTSLFEEYRMYN